MNQYMDLAQRQSLQQTLSPQMIQSLKLLQVNALQLEQVIKQELEINPILEEVQEELDQEQAEEDVSEQQEAEDTLDEEVPEDGELQIEEEEIDWEEYLEDGFDIGYRQSEELSKPSRNDFEPVTVARMSLEEHLMQQLNEQKVSQPLHRIIQHLIGCLNAYGYLTYSLEEVSEDIHVSVFGVEEALNILQRFDPSGIGARDLRECLLIQLRAKKMFDSLEMRIVTNHFDLLQKLKIADIANAMNKSPQEIQQAARTIGSLDPRPGESIQGEKSETIMPDIIVENISGRFVAYLNDGSMPCLQINPTYTRMIRKGAKTPPKIKSFIKDKMTAANWLIRAIEQRKTTMLRVMNAILELQHDFFEKGPAFIKPLVMQTVADNIDMHISTVSRVANGKYAQTPHGIFELKYFFTAGVEQDDGSEVSATKAMRAIKELIEGEDSKNPFSDQKIVQILKERNVDIARRTVAKYRERLKILPARLRKQY